MTRHSAAGADALGRTEARRIQPFAAEAATLALRARDGGSGAGLAKEFGMRFRIPGSKSLTNRHLVLAALASGKSHLRGVLRCDDCDRLMFALSMMGANFEMSGPEHGDLIRVTGVAGKPKACDALNLGDGGTPTRFMLAVAALATGETEIDGSARMRERPIAEGLQMLNALGAHTRCLAKDGALPVAVRGVMQGGALEVGRTASSQFVSALMLVAASTARGVDLTFRETPTSASYLALSYDALRQASIEAALSFGPTPLTTIGQWNGIQRIQIAPQKLMAYDAVIEPDASSAVYLAALAALIDLTIEFSDLPRRGAQPDFAFFDDLELRGARVLDVSSAAGGVALRVSRRAEQLRGRDADYSGSPDAAVMAMVLAGLCDGPSHFTGLHTLRVKESDRIEAVAAGLRALGGRVDTGDDWARVYPLPTQLTPAVISSANDHRIAMSFAILGCARAGVTIDDPAVVQKSWPEFWETLESIRAGVLLQHGAPPRSRAL